MPKTDILLRIDESLAGLPGFYMDNQYDPLADDTPPVPTGVSVRAVQDGILIAIDFNIDKAHLFARFESFIVYARPISYEATDGSGQEVGRIANGQSSWVWHPAYSGYDAWDIALTAISNTGYESAKTAWYRCTLSTFYDNFESYGGATVSALEAIYWLKVANFNSDEAWSTADGGSVDTTNYREGNQAIKITALSSVVYFYSVLDVTLDLSAEGRFDDTDYVVIAAYIDDKSKLTEFVIRFITGAITNAYYKSWLPAAVVNGWNYLKVKKGDLLVIGAPDWSNITGLGVMARSTAPGDTVNVTFDDWRIVKADPDAAATFNDTGAVWDFSDGTWHIYPGNRTGEPAHVCSLGQIETPADDAYFATVHAVEITNGRISTGLEAKGSDGIVGINFRAEDVTLGSEDVLTAELATAGDTITLYRYAAGAKTSLASAAYTCAPDVLYWLGVDFRDPGNENRVKVYVATTEAGLWSADNLKISHATADVWPVGSQVGVVCHACNCRFVQFRAGSAETADYAHTAGVALKLVTTEYPQRATMWHDESLVVTGNAMARPHDASQNYGVLTYQNPGANGDVFTNSCFLRTGIYMLAVLGATASSYGKLDWTLDGVTIATGQDWYSAVTTYNVMRSTANVVVAFDGYHILKGTVNGKNAGSSGYNIVLCKLWFTPAAD